MLWFIQQTKPEKTRFTISLVKQVEHSKYIRKIKLNQTKNILEQIGEEIKKVKQISFVSFCTSPSQLIHYYSLTHPHPPPQHHISRICHNINILISLNYKRWNGKYIHLLYYEQRA